MTRIRSRVRVLQLFLAVTVFAVLPAHADDPPPSPSIEEVLTPVTEERAFRSFRSSMHMVRVSDGEQVFAQDEERALVPASTMKAVTAATALRNLGPAHRFETEILRTGEVDASGVLRGNLVVRGEGDPSMVVEKLWKLVADLQLEGVERIAGDVIYDDSYHSGGAELPGWGKQEDRERGPAYFATLGALSVNFNTVSLVLRPGAEVGKPARARLETPAEGYVKIDAEELLTAEGGARYRLEIERIVEDDGTMTFKLVGSVPLDAETRHFYRTVDNPTRHFMSVFEGLLGRQGIRVDGRHRRGTTPEGATEVVSVRSPALTAILMDMNKFSNNFIAEQVLRAVGAEVRGEGSTAAGVSVVEEYLKSLGLDEKEFSIANGSGLSRQTRLQATHLTAVLLDMVDDPRVGAEFRTSLAIAGTDGTLWRRLVDQPGRLRGKTGTVDGVHCLVGYMEDADGELYAFAFLANDIRGGTGTVKGIHDRLARKIFDVSAPIAVP